LEEVAVLLQDDEDVIIAKMVIHLVIAAQSFCPLYFL
jgi:hypothetical protein